MAILDFELVVAAVEIAGGLKQDRSLLGAVQVNRPPL